MMSTIDPRAVSPYDSLGLSSTSTGAPKGDGLQDQFMTLMLTQMKNQDPLKPMENGEFLAQLAQFNTVSGIQELQTSFADFATSMQTNQALQASGLVGRSVSLPGPAVALTNTGPVEGTVTLPASTTNLRLAVYDSSGQLVRTIGMGAQGEGQVAYRWDGLSSNGTALPPGRYQVMAEALIDGTPTAVSSASYATVESVNLSGSGHGIQLNVAGIGAVPFSEVQQVR